MDSIPAAIAYTLATQPSGTPFAIDPTTVLTQGNYLLTATFTPNDLVNYSKMTQAIPFSVQNMNVFVGNSAGSVTSFYNGGTVQTQAVPGGGIGAAVDSAGNVWSISADGSSLVEYTNDGSLINTFSNINLSAATGIAIDGSGHLWVTNGANSVSLYTTNGSLLATTTSTALNHPSASSIDISGNVWVTNQTNNAVTELLGAGAPTQVLSNAVTAGTPGTQP
jgi:hypothetical protein